MNNLPKGLKPYFTGATLLGLGLMVVDTKMSAEFGYSIDKTAMLGLGMVSIASGIVLIIAEAFRRFGYTTVAYISFAGWAIAFGFNIWSNVGVATANRMGEVQSARVQQTNYSERKKAADEAEARLKLFGDQLQTLLTQNAWAATVTASGLREQVEDLRKSEVAETKLGGCGPKCRAIQNKIADVGGQIAVAEQRANLTKQIEATKAVLAKARDELAGTKAGISATANASTLHAKLVSWNLASSPEDDAVTVANESTGILMAFVIAAMSALLTYIGALPHLAEIVPMSVMPSLHRPADPASWGAPPAQTPKEARLDQLYRNLEARVVRVPLRQAIV